jgi:gluconolactonase
MRSTLLSATTVALLAIVASSCTPETSSDSKNPDPTDSPIRTIGSIERLDPALDALVPQDAKLEILAEGHEWTEGPVWVSDGGYLLYSDIPRNAIYQWSPGSDAKIWLQPSGYTGELAREGEPGSNGLLLDSEGHLILCQHGDRRMARLEAPLDNPTPTFSTLADRFEGKRFNSPNDAVFHSNGMLYFTDPPYGLDGGPDSPAKELDFQGVYRLETDGELILLTDQLSRPNGIALSPDERTLFVASSAGQEQPFIMAYDLDAEGMTSNGRIFFDSRESLAGRTGGFDGMKVDQSGNLFATGPGGVLVISPEGKHLGTLLTTQATANCAFGDDGSTLYVTADMYLLRVRLTTKGLGF